VWKSNFRKFGRVRANSAGVRREGPGGWKPVKLPVSWPRSYVPSMVSHDGSVLWGTDKVM